MLVTSELRRQTQTSFVWYEREGERVSRSLWPSCGLEWLVKELCLSLNFCDEIASPVFLFVCLFCFLNDDPRKLNSGSDTCIA